MVDHDADGVGGVLAQVVDVALHRVEPPPAQVLAGVGRGQRGRLQQVVQLAQRRAVGAATGY